MMDKGLSSISKAVDGLPGTASGGGNEAEQMSL